MLNHVHLRSQSKTFQLLIRNISFISLYYGLTFTPDDHDNPSMINNTFLEDSSLKGDTKLLQFVTKLRHQSYDLRRGIRIHVLKLIKLMGDLDLEFLLRVLYDMTTSSEFSKLVSLNILDFLKYLIRFCDLTKFQTPQSEFSQTKSSNLILWTEILMM